LGESLRKAPKPDAEESATEDDKKMEKHGIRRRRCEKQKREVLMRAGILSV
jgi:hypothetical protein